MAKLGGHAAPAPTVAQRVVALVQPTIADLGFETVRVELLGLKRPRLQVMIERADERMVTLDDCATVSRAISAVLDVEDPFLGAYTLEVSSPGIDRPLVRQRDYDRFAGFEAKVELARPLDGRRRFRGVLRGSDGDVVRLETEEGPVAVPFADIHRAKLILTDALIRAHTTQVPSGSAEGEEAKVR